MRLEIKFQPHFKFELRSFAIFNVLYIMDGREGTLTRFEFRQEHH